MHRRHKTDCQYLQAQYKHIRQAAAAAQCSRQERSITLWQKFHQGPPGSVQLYLQSVSDQLQLGDSLHSFMQQLVQGKCEAATCPSCGSSASPSAAAGSSVEQLFVREVLVVTFSAMISINVPKFKCNR
jgi:hypothetical protein